MPAQPFVPPHPCLTLVSVRGPRVVLWQRLLAPICHSKWQRTGTEVRGKRKSWQQHRYEKKKNKKRTLPVLARPQMHTFPFTHSLMSPPSLVVSAGVEWGRAEGPHGWQNPYQALINWQVTNIHWSLDPVFVYLCVCVSAVGVLCVLYWSDSKD